MRKELNHKASKTFRHQRRNAFGLAGAAGLFAEVSRRGVQIGNRASQFYDPAQAVGNAIAESLDPTRAPSRATSLKDMTPEKRAEMERLYGGGKCRNS